LGEWRPRHDFQNRPRHQPETILYRLTGADHGGIPNGSLTDHDGALYGTTQPGGNRLHCRL